MKKIVLISTAVCGLFVSLPSAVAQGTAFTYEGLLKLTADGSAVTGLYDFSFSLFAADSGGNPVTAPYSKAGVAVTDGLFITTIDFGSVFTGTRYWLEIASRPNGNSTEAFETMSPRQELTPVPYAIFAETAGLAKNIVAPLLLTGAAGSTIRAENSGTGAAVYASSASGDAVTIVAHSGNGVVASSDTSVAVHGISTDSDGVEGFSWNGTGVVGLGAVGGVLGSTFQDGGTGVEGKAGNGTGVKGTSTAVGDGVYGSSNSGRGVYGSSSVGSGVYGSSTLGNGVFGFSASAFGAGAGVWGENPTTGGRAVVGKSTYPGLAGGTGVYGESASLAGVGVSGANTGGGEAGHFEGDVGVIGNLNVTAKASVCTLTIRGGCDVAEPFEISTVSITKGSVVVIDNQNAGQLKISDQPYDRRVAGIVSGANGINPGISLYQQGVLEGGQNVALSGRVYVLADASSAPIKPGDLLTTSTTPGHAMKVTDHGRASGAILGKAMSTLNEGRGLVLVLVTLQ